MEQCKKKMEQCKKYLVAACVEVGVLSHALKIFYGRHKLNTFKKVDYLHFTL